jgi:hypothetical protein
MVWIQSIVCSLLFVANFAWQPKHLAVAIALNVLLAASCAVLLIIAASGAEDVDLTQSKSNGTVRNRIVAGLILLYVVASVAKLNGSSTALWRGLADRQNPAADVILGKARDIRSDEWLVHTPWIWSQAEQKPSFPVSNRNIGNGVAPLLTNVPARHWTMLFRPQMWGFFFLDRERAFAFNWNFKWFALLLSGFLFLRIIARGNNLLALSGALLLLFSNYMQWFFSTPTCMPEMIAMVFFALWAVHIMGAGSSRWAIVGGGFVLLISIEQFVFCAYPRFQIPLVYLAVALLLGGCCGSENDRQKLHYFRAGCLIVALAMAGGLLVQWYREVSPTVREIQGLIYPGQQVSSGAGFSWSRLFAPFLEFSMTETHFPMPLGNACEASGFLFLPPLLGALAVRDLWRGRRDGILIASLVFLAIAIWFMLIGVPAWLARATGWSYVVSSRAMLAVGVASIVGLVRYLARPVEKSETKKRWLLIGAFGLALILFVCLHLANSEIGNFARVTEVTAASIFFAATFCVVWQRRQSASCFLLLLPLLWASPLVNPVERGLPGFARSDVFRWLSETRRNDPNARWMVMGNPTNRTCCLAQFVKATGADVLGGTRCMPDHEMLAVLDPENRYATVHNRYARICFVPSADAEPEFKLMSADDYQVRLPLRSELFESLGVKYILLVDPTEGLALPRFEQMATREGLVLLRRQ